MKLKKISFTEFKGSPQEWVLEELLIGQRNLIVGKNATGKSRVLNVIHALSRILAKLQQATFSGEFSCQWENDGQDYAYELHYVNDNVVHEKLVIDGTIYLTRGVGGEGEIFAQELGKSIKFQSPTTDIAVVVRRDEIQHSYLEPIFSWASAVRCYHFGSQLGKNNLALFHSNAPNVDERDENAVVGIFRDGKKAFSENFVAAIINDMAKIDYLIETVDFGPPISLHISGIPGTPNMLIVKEKGLPGYTDQHSMSQGMFRVLALIIHVNYFLMKQSATCLLVDDIGEGLDFDRSCRLIELLRQKATDSKIQIVLSTNDRFVMNNVPLEEWSILQRKGNHVTVRNYQNSKEIFDDFKFSGLSNFSFLEFDVINEREE